MKSWDTIVDASGRLLASTDQLAAAIRPLFPPDCSVAVERRAANLDALTPREANAVQKAVPKRQGEFAAGRIAARRALSAIGLKDAEIPTGADRAPEWPTGTIGSISHAGDVAVAVVALTSQIEALGIDIELEGAVQAELWPLVLLPSECQWVESHPADEQRQWATMLFSAKEAFYKFQYPLTRRWLDFRDVEITVPSADAFAVKVLQPPIPVLATPFQGRMTRLAGFTLTVLSRAR